MIQIAWLIQAMAELFYWNRQSKLVGTFFQYFPTKHNISVHNSAAGIVWRMAVFFMKNLMNLSFRNSADVKCDRLTLVLLPSSSFSVSVASFHLCFSLSSLSLTFSLPISTNIHTRRCTRTHTHARRHANIYKQKHRNMNREHMNENYLVVSIHVSSTEI